MKTGFSGNPKYVTLLLTLDYKEYCRLDPFRNGPAIQVDGGPIIRVENQYH